MELIPPIFKDGSLDDPDNYRDTCTSSVLLKIVCSLLQKVESRNTAVDSIL